MGEKQKPRNLDGLRKIDRRIKFFDLPLARFANKYRNSSVLFSKQGRTDSFFTQDSKLYITPEEHRRIISGERIVRVSNRLDSALSRNFTRTKIYSIGQKDVLYLDIRRRYASLKNYVQDLASGSVRGVSMARMWNLSIVGAVIFGMLTMTMIYKYLGQNVSAQIQNSVDKQQAAMNVQEQSDASNVFDAGDYKNDEIAEIDTAFITKLLENSADKAQADFEEEIRQMVKGYPIEKMVPDIAKQDRIVAAFIIGIAKQESDWGKHIPVYQGQDCYNYWGYRGKNPVGTGGHTCFESPQDAVQTVANRIQFLVSNKKLNTPEKMIIWKCGDCSWDNRQNMNIWISAVSTYFQKLNTEN